MITCNGFFPILIDLTLTLYLLVVSNDICLDAVDFHCGYRYHDSTLYVNYYFNDERMEERWSTKNDSLTHDITGESDVTYGSNCNKSHL